MHCVLRCPKIAWTVKLRMQPELLIVLLHYPYRVGLAQPSVEIRFDDLTIEAGVYVGGRALPNLLNASRNAVESLFRTLHLARDKRRRFQILRNVSGILKPVSLCPCPCPCRSKLSRVVCRGASITIIVPDTVLNIRRRLSQSLCMQQGGTVLAQVQQCLRVPAALRCIGSLPVSCPCHA